MVRVAWLWFQLSLMQFFSSVDNISWQMLSTRKMVTNPEGPEKEAGVLPSPNQDCNQVSGARACDFGHSGPSNPQSSQAGRLLSTCGKKATLWKWHGLCPSPDTCPCPRHTLKTFTARCRSVKELGQAYPSPNTGICYVPQSPSSQ